MTNREDKLQKAIFGEIQKLKRAADVGRTGSQPRVLGAFIQAALNNTGRSRADFAKATGMDEELVDALLEGLLPESLISDQTLAEIAQVLGYEPNVLRILLKRHIEPTQSDDSAQNQA